MVIFSNSKVFQNIVTLVLCVLILKLSLDSSLHLFIAPISVLDRGSLVEDVHGFHLLWACSSLSIKGTVWGLFYIVRLWWCLCYFCAVIISLSFYIHFETPLGLGMRNDVYWKLNILDIMLWDSGSYLLLLLQIASLKLLSREQKEVVPNYS